MYVGKKTSYKTTPSALTSQDYRAIEGGVFIDSSKVPLIDQKKILRRNEMLGKITASGEYRAVGYTKVTAAGTVNTVKLDNVRWAVVNDVITVKDQTGRNVTAIDYANNTITFDGAAVAVVIGDVVKLEDGAEKAELFLPDEVDVTEGDQLAGGYDMCRLNEARMPIIVHDQIKTDVSPLIKFE